VLGLAAISWLLKQARAEKPGSWAPVWIFLLVFNITGVDATNGRQRKPPDQTFQVAAAVTSAMIAGATRRSKRKRKQPSKLQDYELEDDADTHSTIQIAKKVKANEQTLLGVDGSKNPSPPAEEPTQPNRHGNEEEKKEQNPDPA